MEGWCFEIRVMRKYNDSYYLSNFKETALIKEMTEYLVVLAYSVKIVRAQYRGE